MFEDRGQSGEVCTSLCRSVKMDTPRETVHSAAQVEIRFLKIIISGIEIHAAAYPRLRLKSSISILRFHERKEIFRQFNSCMIANQGPHSF